MRAMNERILPRLVARSLGEYAVKLEKQKSALLTWMFVFWVGTMGTVVAILKL